MSDPRLNPAALVSAATGNAVWAQRLGWGTKAGGQFKSPADPQLAIRVTDFQEAETAQGRTLRRDGELGPNTLAAVNAARARAAGGAAAAAAAAAAAGAFGAPITGAAGADPWGLFWGQQLTFGKPAAPAPAPAVEPPRRVEVAEVIIPGVDPVPAPGGGMSGLAKGLLALAAVWGLTKVV